MSNVPSSNTRKRSRQNKSYDEEDEIVVKEEVKEEEDDEEEDEEEEEVEEDDDEVNYSSSNTSFSKIKKQKNFKHNKKSLSNDHDHHKKKKKKSDIQEDIIVNTNKNTNQNVLSFPPKKKSKITTLLPIQESNMFQYVHFKILDSIGFPGAYRKFMMKRKDQGAQWAIEMNEHIAQVHSAIKELNLIEQDIKKSSILKNLDIVWQHVIESNVPPSDLNLTIGTCLITNKPNLPCIVIRGKGRGANNFTVSSKFASFLYHLWMVYKMDMLIKVYTRKALEEIDPQGTLILADIAQHFKARESEVHNLSRALHSAYTHVYRSAKGGLMAVV